MPHDRKVQKAASGKTSKGPRPKRKIVALDAGKVLLDCGHARPASGKERVGGERRCEECPARRSKYTPRWVGPRTA